MQSWQRKLEMSENAFSLVFQTSTVSPLFSPLALHFQNALSLLLWISPFSTHSTILEFFFPRHSQTSPVSSASSAFPECFFSVSLDISSFHQFHILRIFSPLFPRHPQFPHWLHTSRMLFLSFPSFGLKSQVMGM